MQIKSEEQVALSLELPALSLMELTKEEIREEVPVSVCGTRRDLE